MARSKAGAQYDIVAQTLASNRLGVFAVVFFVLAAAAPMTVVAGGATTGWAVTGVLGIPISYIAVALVLALFSVGYTAMSRKIVNAGAFYSYISRGLGRVAGVGAAFVALLAYNTMQIGLFGGFGPVIAAQIGEWAGVHLSWWVYAFIAWGIIGILGVMRVDVNGLVLAVLLVAEIVIALIYAAVEVVHPANGHVTYDSLAISWLWNSNIGAGFATAIAGFVGFEATAVFAEETKDPRRTVPRATYLSLIIIGVLYGGSSWAMSVAAGADKVVGRARTDSTELMFNLVLPYLGKVWVGIGHLLFITSLFAALLAFHNTAARYAFALGRERVLPAFLGRTATNNAPKWGSITQTILAGVVLAIYAAVDKAPIVHLFFWWTVLGGLGVLILMTATSVAVVWYFGRPENRRDAGIWSGFIAPVIASGALAYLLYLTLNKFDVLLGITDPASPWPVILPSLFGIAALVGITWAIIIKLTRPFEYTLIGLGANAVNAEERILAGIGSGDGGR